MAALGGFLLGYRRGRTIVSALAGYAEENVSRSVNELLGQDVL